MAHVPVSRTIAKRFGGEANLRMAVSKAVSGLTLTSVTSQLHLSAASQLTALLWFSSWIFIQWFSNLPLNF